MKFNSKNILLLPGDGIGPEVCTQAVRVLDWFSKNGNTKFEIESDLVGGACYDVHQVAITNQTIALAKAADAVLFGAVGAPQYDNVPRDARPEAGLLRLRKELDLFANLRPAITFDELLGASSLKPEIIQGLDLLIVRELTSGVYFGMPRGIEKLKDGSERCIDTQSYTTQEIERVTRVAFDLSRLRNSKVHSVEKANVMETGAFWRKTVSTLHARENYTDIDLHHMFADNCAMQLVRNPKQFDVIVTDNLFGDLLSDAAAMCTGSLGMLPSASLGARHEDGSVHSMYEPVHGTAPDIAGKNLANPIAMILSTAMMLRYSFKMTEEADMLETAVRRTLSDGVCTPDIATAKQNPVSTQKMTDIILRKLASL